MDIIIEPINAAPDITRVTIDGRIDAYTVERVDEELNSLIRIGTSKLICDLSAVEFVAGPGLKTFLRTIQTARKHKGDMKLCGLRPEVERMFALAGFSSIAKLYPDETAALRDFGVDVPGGGAEFEQTMIAGSSAAFEQTMIAPSAPKPEKDIGFEQTMIAPPSSKKDIGFEQTMIEQPAAKDIGFEQTMIEGGKPAGGMPDDLRAKLAQAGKKKDPPAGNAAEALRKKLQAQQPQAPEITDQAAQTILEQIDRVEKTEMPPAPSEPEAKKEKPAPTPARTDIPYFQPVTLTLPPEEKHLSHVSQLLGAMGALAGLKTMKMVKFSVAVTETCRALVADLPPGKIITLEFDASDKRFIVSLTVPVAGFNLYDHLRPKMESDIQTAAQAEAWLKKFAGDVESESVDGGTCFRLILS